MTAFEVLAQVNIRHDKQVNVFGITVRSSVENSNGIMPDHTKRHDGFMDRSVALMVLNSSLQTFAGDSKYL